MFPSSSPYADPAFCCAAGTAPLRGTTPVHTLSSPNNCFMQSSSSSTTHSFAYSSVPDPAPSPFFSSSSPPSACALLDFHPEPVRRAFSTGDLQVLVLPI